MNLQDSYAYPPRGLSRTKAARHIGVGTTFFDQLVVDGRMPKPFNIGKRVIWDRLKIDAAFSYLGEVRENFFGRGRRLTAASSRKP